MGEAVATLVKQSVPDPPITPTKEDCPPVKQKVRRMHSEMSEKIKDEVMKQFDASFLAVTSYPQWVANVVPSAEEGW